MKQEKLSNTTVTTEATFLQKKGRTTQSQFHTVRYTKQLKSILALLCIALAIFVYILAQRGFSNRSALVDSVSSTGHALEVEVLDGAGSMKVAQHVTNFLRTQGYDVVEMKRNNAGIVEHSFVLDRSGNLDATRQLAANLGVSPEKVFQKIDCNLYLDVTVVIGKDFSQLKAIQIATGRNVR